MATEADYRPLWGGHAIARSMLRSRSRAAASPAAPGSATPCSSSIRPVYPRSRMKRRMLGQFSSPVPGSSCPGLSATYMMPMVSPGRSRLRITSPSIAWTLKGVEDEPDGGAVHRLDDRVGVEDAVDEHAGEIPFAVRFDAEDDPGLLGGFRERPQVIGHGGELQGKRHPRIADRVMQRRSPVGPRRSRTQAPCRAAPRRRDRTSTISGWLQLSTLLTKHPISPRRASSEPIRSCSATGRSSRNPRCRRSLGRRRTGSGQPGRRIRP
jgi:hypothetical protein